VDQRLGGQVVLRAKRQQKTMAEIQRQNSRYEIELLPLNMTQGG
jgi:hypothetical protein